jgi:hypothetical protein
MLYKEVFTWANEGNDKTIADNRAKILPEEYDITMG